MFHLKTSFARRVALGALTALALAAAVPGGAATAAPEPVQWAALGDSYTAGVFVGSPSPELGSTERDGCDRTTGAYPNLVERRFTVEPPAGRPVKLTDFSCGAATIAEIATARQTPISPVQPPEGGWPSVDAQIERAGLSASTDVVTIGVGGNSLPFGKIVTSCLILGTGQEDDATPCRDAYERGDFILDPESIQDKFQRVFREYVEMLEAVHDKAPNAKVITVGYPTIVPADATTCDRQDTTELAADLKDAEARLSATHGDIAWLGQVNTELNSIIEDVTDLVDYGYTYVDVAASSVGHDACQPRATKWVEGVCGQAGPYWPTDITVGLVALKCSNGNRSTLVHPNAAGHANTAALVEAAVRKALT
ncbi:lipase [Streptomyces inusitatus]|uniref:Lipase n=1 Tax=Streptomyces inusitatus TaxID=68221 RepID=A0A918PPZ0_9ACTN|nr:SGNH/GDSL hydrolase family protein [Streptomyces inusitatus]GGZ18636.1 lipase [Streptomyces inusitatus]